MASTFEDMPDRCLKKWRQDVEAANRVSLKKAAKPSAVGSKQIIRHEAAVFQQSNECLICNVIVLIDNSSRCLNISGCEDLPSNTLRLRNRWFQALVGRSGR